MNSNLSAFADSLRPRFLPGCAELNDATFDLLARQLFALQFAHNPVYQRLCTARGATPETVAHWTAIPAVPTAAFKELEVTCLPPAQRTAVFHSSGTTTQKPSRHFHGVESLALYEASLWQWFTPHFSARELWFLTPPPDAVPHSSLVHMFGTLRRHLALPTDRFLGRLTADGTWVLDLAAVRTMLESAVACAQPIGLLGTAFSFVHLLDALADAHQTYALPAGSQVMETGGYKNRSRSLPKPELHALITRHLGVPRPGIICEYGMSELSSQAYDNAAASGPERRFCFPPWARVLLLNPETGAPAAPGEPGLIRVLDLANVFSVAAVQTEDLGVLHAGGLEWLGRAGAAEPRGCSLQTA